MGYKIPLQSFTLTLFASSDRRVIPLQSNHTLTRVEPHRGRKNAPPSVRSSYDIFFEGWKDEHFLGVFQDGKLSRVAISHSCLIFVEGSEPRVTWSDGKLRHTWKNRSLATSSKIKQDEYCYVEPKADEPLDLREDLAPTCPICATSQWHVVFVRHHELPLEITKAAKKIKVEKRYRERLPSRFDRFEDEPEPEEVESEPETIDPEDFNEWEGPQGRQPKLVSRVRSGKRAKAQKS